MRARNLAGVVSLALAAAAMPGSAAAAGQSLRFHGTGTGEIDRVKVRIDGPARPADVGFDFTLEWWMKANAAENTAPGCTPGPIGIDGWIGGNILFDRDVSGDGDHGEYGVSLRGGRIAFGVSRGAPTPTGQTICGAVNVADGAWHHVAVTRRSGDGALAIYVDGTLDRSGTGPTGDISYRDGRGTLFPDHDPFLVIGAEKWDSPASFSYSGWLDEVRLSSVVRYTGSYTPPRQPFRPRAGTVALYHFDEGYGDRIVDESNAAGGPSHGERRFGGPTPGPELSSDTPPFPTATALAYDSLASGLSSPLGIAHAGDGSGRVFVVQQRGQIRIWNGTQLLATPFLDLSSRVSPSGGERGLLGLAFHPSYEANGLFYVYYTRASDGDIVIARYQVTADPNVADFDSEAIMIVIDHPAGNHNGGNLAFGLDGYLYAAPGDGGGGGDPQEAAQDLSRLLGKMLRIDVNQNVGTPPFYGIPPDNPLVGGGCANGCDEIWSYGLRNPWRFSFDRLTGGQFIGDVGQSTREEIDLQQVGEGAPVNWGWDVLEGTFCHENVPAGSCAAFLSGASRLPILEYGRDEGSTVIGGVVNRALPRSTFTGRYLFSDFFVSGGIWTANAGTTGSTWTKTQITLPPPGTTSFLAGWGEDERGVVHSVALSSGTLNRLASYTFTDVLPSNQSWRFVESLFAAGITSGCATAQYCPNASITRAQMAIFLLRGKYDQTHLPPPASGAVFADVPASDPVAPWVEQLAAEGITTGCAQSPPRFCPTDPVRRDQMAIFILRTLEGGTYTPPPCTGIFADMPCSNAFAPWAEELFRRGITTGCTAGNYCPAAAVTRAQMAAFLTRAFALP